jgi:glycosyltransferase involved in cell wall biosynthesis
MSDLLVTSAPPTTHSEEALLLSVLMPVFNEREYLRECVETILAVPLPGSMGREIVLVDDASTDETRNIASELARENPNTIRLFVQEKNGGKGTAIQRAIVEMRGDLAIIQDADMEYDPNDYLVLLPPLLDGRADVVYGSRFATKSERPILKYRHQLGNKFLTFLSNLMTDMNLTDMETCYKLFKADILRDLDLESRRFGIEPEITAKIARRNYSVFEVPIKYDARTRAEGKKIGWRDGVSAIYTILKYSFRD